MSTAIFHSSEAKHLSIVTFRRFVTAVSFAMAASAVAQSIMVTEQPLPLAPRIVQQSAPADSFAPDYKRAVSGTPITLGEFRIHPFMHTSFLKSEGLPSGQGINVDTDIFTFSVGLTAEAGDHWIMNYSPTWVNYSSSSMRDSVNHDFKLIGATTVNAWNLQFSEGYQSSTDILAETAEQTKQHTWATLLSASRSIGLRSNYEGSVSLNERYAEKAPDAVTWSTQHWLRMQVSPKVNAGVGIDLALIDFTNSNRANMKSIQYLGQLNWRPTKKLNFAAQGGLERRRSEAAGTETLKNPTLQISLGYQPLEHTSISLANFRGVSNSYFDDTVTKNKGWSVSINQRLLEKLHLDVSYSQQTSDYTTFGGSTTPSSLVAGRSDDLNSFNATLSVQIFQHWTVGAIYQRSKNDSEHSGIPLPNYSFTTTQYGVELSGRF